MARFRDDVVVRNGGYVVCLGTTRGYFVTPHTSLGFGFGLNVHHRPGYNAPLGGALLLETTSTSPFVAVNAGYFLRLASSF